MKIHNNFVMSRGRYWWALPLLLAPAILALPGRQAPAQENTIPRPVPPYLLPPLPVPPPRPLQHDLELVSQRAQVQVQGAVARTALKQVFRNTASRTIEGTYLFPLPEGAAITDFAMTMNGKRMAAEILEGDKARQIYTSIVQKMRDPAILEYLDRNLIQARIFPLAARAEVEVELNYAETLRTEGGNAFRYVLPLRLPVGGAARSAVVEMDIETPAGIRAVYSPTHNVEVRKEQNRALVSGEFGSPEAGRRIEIDDPRNNPPANRELDKVQPRQGSDRDFILYYTTTNQRVGVSFIGYQPPEEDGYFMLLLAPDPAVAPREIAAKDVIFVFDTSGSMAGEKMEQARKALLNLLTNLNANDTFNIITFASDINPFRPAPVSASAANLTAAREWAGGLKAAGGTNINEALLEALRMMPGAENRPRQIVFLTDGQPTVGETDVAQIQQNIRRANGVAGAVADREEAGVKARVFVFGVGFDVNTRLLDTLAEDNRGASDYVAPQEDIEQKVGSLYSKIAYPVLANPQVDWGGLNVFDVYPRRLPDLFRGTQAVVFGRYRGTAQRGAAPAKLQLIGTAAGKREVIPGEAGLGTPGRAHDTLPRLWAMRKVGYLLDDARRANRPVSDEVRDEIIRLSKRYAIVTPFTAGLITEDERPVQIIDNGGTVIGHSPSPRLGGVAGPPGRALDSMAAAPSAGEAAVAYSRETNALKRRERVSEASDIRYVAGKAFVLRGGVWTDTAYDAAKSPAPSKVKFASTEYFALVKDSRVARWLSLGEKVLFVLGNRTIQVEP